jgi:hypothetical protein
MFSIPSSASTSPESPNFAAHGPLPALTAIPEGNSKRLQYVLAGILVLAFLACLSIFQRPSPTTDQTFRIAPMTPEDGVQFDPSVSPDSTKLAYVAYARTTDPTYSSGRLCVRSSPL